VIADHHLGQIDHTDINEVNGVMQIVIIIEVTGPQIICQM